MTFFGLYAPKLLAIQQKRTYTDIKCGVTPVCRSFENFTETNANQKRTKIQPTRIYVIRLNH